MKAILLTSALLSLSTAAFAAKTTLKVDSAKSEVTWTGKKVLVQSAHTGNIKIKEGSIEMKGNDIVGGSFEIDMTSLTNTDLKGNPKLADLEGHLKSPDFFDVQKFPTAKFVIKSAKTLAKPAAGAPTHEITGDLTLKGETKPLTFTAVVAKGGAEATANIKFDRTAWNVRYASGKFFQGLGDKVIADEIELGMKLVTTK